MVSTNNSTNSASTTYSYLQFKNKIGGLVSGMDIDSIMEKLMKAQSAQMEKLQQQKQKYEWKRDAYREINTKLNTYQQDLFDKYALKSSWNSKSATVSDNSSVTVTAGTNASGNLSISQVKKAEAAQSIVNDVNYQTEKITENTQLDKIGLLDREIENFEIFGQSAIETDGDTSTVINMGKIKSVLKDNGYEVNISSGVINISANSTVNTMDEKTINSLNSLGFNLTNNVNEKTTSILKTGETVADSTTKLSDLNLDNGKLTVGNKEIDLSTITHLNSTDSTEGTLGDLVKKVQDEGYNADIIDGRIVISTKDGSELLITSDNINLDNDFSSTVNLTKNTSKVFVEKIENSTKKLYGSNTIQDLMNIDATSMGSFTLNAIQADGEMKSTDISFKATDTIDSLISKINSSGAGVTALFKDGQFSISANNTGQNTKGAEISITTSLTQNQMNEMTDEEENDWNLIHSVGNSLMSKLSGIAVPTDGSELKLADNGSDASIIVNGVTYKQSSNLFSIAGYEITATKDFNVGEKSGDSYTIAASNEKISVTSTVDVDKTIDKVKEFVTMYNDLIAELNSKTTEKKNVDYAPLTDAQKAEMTESQIEKWEEKAKAGLLKGDTTLTNVLSKMRQTLFTYGTSSIASNSKEGTTAVGIKGETLSSIGISTSSTWSDNGKLEIDEDKLRAALEKDPDIVSRIFTGDGTKENPGVVSQLRTTAQEAVKTIEKSAGKDTSASETSYSIGKTINSLTTKIDDWKDRLKDIEERYWKQFSAMETAIQKANSQSSIFSA